MQKPKIQIVNDKDEIIGYKKRDEVDFKNDIYRVAALWLSNSNGEVLIAQRKLTKDKDPGKWGPAVAGTVDEGETYDQNIVKEIEEEVGVKGLDIVKGPHVRITKPRNYFCQWFTAKLDKSSNEFIVQEDEVEKVEWIDFESLVKEVESDPEKYIPSMPGIIELFS